MGRPRNRPMSDNQKRVLGLLLAGKPPHWGLTTMSEHGGLTNTLAALWRRGLIDEGDKLTDEGRRVAEGLKAD